MITAKQLSQAIGCPLLRALKWVDYINVAMLEYQINTPMRAAHYLAQIGHESGRLFYVKEIASGKAYEGRKDLGNTQTGDGVRFKGRALIQITGRANYAECSKSLFVDFLNNPELLEKPIFAALSSAWFWKSRGLNELADKDYLTAITKKINGGQNGIDDRRTLLISAKKALGI